MNHLVNVLDRKCIDGVEPAHAPGMLTPRDKRRGDSTYCAECAVGTKREGTGSERGLAMGGLRTEMRTA